MRKLFPLFGGAIALIFLGVLFWWFRPWSEYSPHEVYKFSKTQDRTVPFRAMETIYPHRTIAASPMPYTFPRGETLPQDAYTTAQGERITFDDYADDRRVTGLMVVSKGEVVFERYFNGETASDRHTSWSVAKSVIATLIGRALMDGEIADLDDPAATYASEYEGTPYGAVSIRHLLMMSSGIDFNEDYEAPGSDVRKLFFGTFFWNKDVDGIVREHEPKREAGEAFHYISSNTAVLAAVLRGAYDGESVPALTERYVFAPLGLGAGTWLTDKPGGKALGYCCLQITLEDYAKLGRLYVQDGVVNGERLIPEGWADFVGTPPQASHEPKLGTLGGRGHGYGHHFWVPPSADGEFYMAGYNGQIVWIDTKRDVVIAMTSADTDWPGSKVAFVPMARALAAEAAQMRADG